MLLLLAKDFTNVLGLLRQLDWHRRRGWHAPEIVDVPGGGQRVLQGTMLNLIPAENALSRADCSNSS